MNPSGKRVKTQSLCGDLKCRKEPLLCAIVLSGISSGTRRGSGHVCLGKSWWEGNVRKNGVSGCEWWRAGEGSSALMNYRVWTVWCGPVTQNSREGRALSKRFSTRCLYVQHNHRLSSRLVNTTAIKVDPSYYHTGKSISGRPAGADRLPMGSLIYWSQEENWCVTTKYPTKLLQGWITLIRNKTKHCFLLLLVPSALSSILNIKILLIWLNLLGLGEISLS